MKSFKEFVKSRDPELVDEAFGFLGDIASTMWNFGKKEYGLYGLQKQIKQVQTKSAKLLDNAYKPLIEKMTEISGLIQKTSDDVKNVQNTVMSDIQNIKSGGASGQPIVNPNDLKELQKVQDTINQKTTKSLSDFGKIKENLRVTWHLAQENQKELESLMGAAAKGIQSQRKIGRGDLNYTGTGGTNPNVLTGQLPGFTGQKAHKMKQQARNTANPPVPPNPTPAPGPTP